MKTALHSRVCLDLAVITALCLCNAAPLHAQSSAPAAASTAPEFREVVDEVGRTVRIPQPVRRIVSLAPSMTETVYALGLQDRLVGDTDFCDYPPDAQTKPKVGGGVNPSLEKIASLHPDLVLLTKAFNLAETAHSLDSLGISSYATDPHSVNDIMTSTRKLAGLLGIPATGAAVADEMQLRLSALQKHVGTLPLKSALFVVWTQPLISVGRSTFIADALLRAGAVSVVDSSRDWPQVSLEEVAHLQPDYLVFAESHAEPVSREMEALATLPGWKILNAVAYRHFAVISDAVNRPAPRIVSAIEDLARQLHPEAFAEKPPDAKQNPEKENPSSRPQPLADSSGDTETRPGKSTASAGGCPCAL